MTFFQSQFKIVPTGDEKKKKFPTAPILKIYFRTD